MEGISNIEKPQQSDYSLKPHTVNIPRRLDIIREEGVEDHNGNFVDPLADPSFEESKQPPKQKIVELGYFGDQNRTAKTP